MRYLILSKYGDGLALSYRLQDEGNQVKAFLTYKPYDKVGQGWIDRVESLDEGLSWEPDVVVCDRNNVTSEAEHCRDEGFLVFGASPLHKRLEEDRPFALGIVEKYGILVPDWQEFSASAEAIKFLKANKGKWVLKFGSGDSIPTRLTESEEDAIAYLEDTKPKQPFIVQEHIDGKLELNTEAWFSDGSLIEGSINHGMEQKRFLAGDMGPNTGCESNLTWTSSGAAFDETFGAGGLLGWLEEEQYAGPIDIAAIMDEEGRLWFLEFTPRLGYSAIFSMLPILNSDLGQIFYECASGSIPEFNLSKDYGFAVTLSTTPYPYEMPKEHIINERLRLGPDLEPGDSFWPIDLSFKDDVWRTAGAHGLLGYATSSSPSPQDAVYTALHALEGTKGTNLQWRTDAGNPTDKIALLRKFGYL